MLLLATVIRLREPAQCAGLARNRQRAGALGDEARKALDVASQNYYELAQGHMEMQRAIPRASQAWTVSGLI